MLADSGSRVPIVHELLGPVAFARTSLLTPNGFCLRCVERSVARFVVSHPAFLLFTFREFPMPAFIHRIAIAPRAGTCRRTLAPSARRNWRALGSDMTGTGFGSGGSQPLDRSNHAGFSLEMCTS